MEIVYIAPMELPVPHQSGAVEEIVWQLGKRLKDIAKVYIYNPLSDGMIFKLLQGLRFSFYNCSHTCIVHSHNLYASLAISNIPGNFNHILTLHYPPNITKSKWRKKALKSALKHLDFMKTIITVPSLYVKHILKGMGIRNVIYIPNGVDTELFSPLKRSEEIREKMLGGKDVLIVNVGRIHPDKNQLPLLSALKELVTVRGYKNVKLILIGPKSGTYKGAATNPYYNFLINYIQKNGLKQYVTLLELPRAQVAKILASSDIYVHPSKVETAPLAVLEAMASQLPVIAFDLPYYRGYLINQLNSLLVTPYDINMLTEYIIDLIENPQLRKKIAKNALRVATEVFSWNVIVQRYIRLYRILTLQ